MNIRRICKNVGHDGESYFCMRCGKAGYSTKEQAMGHLAKCKARETATVLPSQPASQLASQPASNLANLPAQLPTILPLGTSAIERQLMVFGQQLSEIKQEQSKLSNETTHMVAMNNQDFFSGKGLLILVVIGVVAYLLGRENCSCDYSVGGTVRRTKSNGFGSAMAGKIAGKFIDKVF